MVASSVTILTNHDTLRLSFYLYLYYAEWDSSLLEARSRGFYTCGQRNKLQGLQGFRFLKGLASQTLFSIG